MERWARANNTSEAACLVELLDLSRLPHKLLSQQVIPSGLVGAEQVVKVTEHVEVARKRDSDSGRFVKLSKGKKLEALLHGVTKITWKSVEALAVGCKGKSAQLAVVDCNGTQVTVFTQHDLTAVYTLGHKDFNQVNDIGFPLGVTSALFNRRGDLIVADVVSALWMARMELSLLSLWTPHSDTLYTRTGSHPGWSLPYTLHCVPEGPWSWDEPASRL